MWPVPTLCYSRMGASRACLSSSKKRWRARCRWPNPDFGKLSAGNVTGWGRIAANMCLTKRGNGGGYSKNHLGGAAVIGLPLAVSFRGNCVPVNVVCISAVIKDAAASLKVGTRAKVPDVV